MGPGRGSYISIPQVQFTAARDRSLREITDISIPQVQFTGLRAHRDGQRSEHFNSTGPIHSVALQYIRRRGMQISIPQVQFTVVRNSVSSQ